MNEQAPVPLPPMSAEKPPLSWRDWAGPLAALGLAALWFSVFSLEKLILGRYAPGLGATAYVFAHFAAVFVFRRRKAPPDRAGLWLMAAALVLAICMALYSAWPIVLINCFVILCVSAAATFRLSGHSELAWDDARSIGETIRLTWRALTSRLGRVFEAIGLAAKRRNKTHGFWLGLLCALPLLAVVVALLSSADAVFGGLFDSLFRSLAQFDLATAIRCILRTVALALFLASALAFLGQEYPAAASTAREAKEPNALPYLAGAFMLDGVYLLFVVIQIAYLFGGAESAAMAGGWAKYARSGFFQLVCVAAVNLLFCLLSSGGGRLTAKGGHILRCADTLMLALSCVILASAAWRMALYIRAFGLSLLRLMTLWAMVFIAVLLVAALVRLWRETARFFRVFVGFGLAAWCLFCLCNPAGLVAQYNLSAHASGTLEELDLPYLEQFYPDTKRVLAAYGYEMQFDQPAPTWSEWRLGFVF